MRCFAVWHVLRFIHLTLSSTVPFVHVSPVILDVQPQLLDLRGTGLGNVASFCLKIRNKNNYFVNNKISNSRG